MSGRRPKIGKLIRKLARFIRDNFEQLFENQVMLRDHLSEVQNRVEEVAEESTDETEDSPDREDLRESIEELHAQQTRQLEQLTGMIEDLLEGQSELAEQLQTIAERLHGPEGDPDADLLKSVGEMVQDDDRLLSSVTDLMEECPEGCYAADFAAEVSERLRGMRSERVSLLAANDVELIDSAETFDTSLHRATGTVPRPEGASGEGRVERIGLVRRNGEDRQVLQRALVSVFEDAQVTSCKRKGG